MVSKAGKSILWFRKVSVNIKKIICGQRVKQIFHITGTYVAYTSFSIDARLETAVITEAIQHSG